MWPATNVTPRTYLQGKEGQVPRLSFSLLTNKVWTNFIGAEQKASQLREQQFTTMEQAYGDIFSCLYRRDPAQTASQHPMKWHWEELETLHPL